MTKCNGTSLSQLLHRLNFEEVSVSKKPYIRLYININTVNKSCDRSWCAAVWDAALYSEVKTVNQKLL